MMRGRGGGPRGGGARGMTTPGPPQSAKDLRAGIRQLMARLRPEALAIVPAPSSARPGSRRW